MNFLCNAKPKPFFAFAFFMAASFFTVPSHAETDTELMTSGQWHDPETGLIWMRCSIGQKWDGKTCTGAPLRLSWDDAVNYVNNFTNGDSGFAGHSDWRLPAIEELITLRRCSNSWSQITQSKLTPEGRRDVAVGVQYKVLPNGQDVPTQCATGSKVPVLDARIFPNTAASIPYWSSSKQNYNVWLGYEIYQVNFEYGSFYMNRSKDSSGTSFLGYVRAVRTAQ